MWLTDISLTLHLGMISCPRLEFYTTANIEQTLPHGSCFAIPPQTSFTSQLIAYSGSSNVSIMDIETTLPSGAVARDIAQIPHTNGYYVNVTWTPQMSQYNQTHMLCFTAVRSNGLTIDESCVSLVPGFSPPIPVQVRPNRQLVYPSNTTWYVEFDRNIYRPLEPSYITFHEYNTQEEVYRIDVSQLQEATFETSHRLSVTPNFRFTEQMQFSIKFDRGIVQGQDLCGLESEPLVDGNYWTFETRDVTPPEISFVLNPAVSNENISASWDSNENVSWECVLTYRSVQTPVNCSNASWVGYGLPGGSYVLSVQARDDAGNIATQTHPFEIDVTPPLAMLTSVPRPISNEQSVTLAFTCNEVCSYQCYLMSNMSLGNGSSCNSGRFSTPALSPNTNYTLVVIATDQLGNTAEGVSYSWITDFEAPAINISQSVDGLCGFTDPEHTGEAQTTDNRPEGVSLTFRDVQNGCTIRRTWMATDNAGNIAQQVQNINTDFTPTISLSSPLSLTCDSTLSSQQVSSSTATAPNPCRLPLQLSFDDSVSALTCPASFVRNWTVSGCGRTSSELQIIHLFDICPPHACGRNETIPRGTCSFGQCYCNRPWYGDDCEVIILQPVAEPMNDDTLQEAEEYTTTITLAQGTSPISWTLISGPSLLQVDQYTGQVTWRRPVAGNHSISVLARNEIGETRVDWSLQVIPGYSARVNPVSPMMYPYAQPMTITGSVEYAINNTIERELGGIVPVEINITNNGDSRIITAYTTPNGSFSETFYPAPTEYGTYSHS